MRRRCGTTLNLKTRHSAEQLIQALQEHQAGAPGAEVSDAKRLRLIEDENRKLKKLVADQALDMMVLKELLAKKF